MTKKIGTSSKLYTLVAIMCVFITGMGLYGIREMKSMKQNSQTLLADRILPLQQLTNIRYTYATNIFALTEQLQNHSIKGDEAINQIKIAEKLIDDNWQAYLKTYLTPEEQQLVQLTIPLKAKADKAVAELKQKIENTNANFSGDSIVKETSAAINPVISKLYELAQLQIKVSSQLNETNDQLYVSTAKKFYWLIVISLIFAGALAFLIINDNRVLINDLKISSQKIKEEEAKVSAFIKYAGDAIFMLDEDLRIVDSNDSAINLVGYSKEELLKMKISDIMAPEEKESLSTKLEAIKKEGGSIHERKMKRKDGGVVDTEVNVRILKGTGYISVMRDISERKRAELRIMERESQLTAFFENIEGAAALLDAEKKYILFNSRFIYDHRLLTKQDPYVGQEVYDLFPEEIRKSRLKLLDNVLQGSKEVVEIDYVRDGKRVCYRTSFTPVIINGKVTGISTYSIDLSKSKEAEIKVRESEEKFRMSFMTSPDAFYIGTLNDGKIIDVNEGFYNVFGYTREEVLGKTSPELNIYSDNDDRAKLFEGLRTDGKVKDLELIMRKKTGEVVIVSISANTSEMNNEKIILAVIRDITERKRAQELFRQSQEEFRLMFEGAAIGVALVGPEGIPLRCNPALCRMLGYTESELTRMAFTEFTHPEDVDKDLKLFQSLIKDEINHYQIEKRYIRKDGRIIWGFLTVSLVRVQDESLRYAVGMVEDITERKNAEDFIKEQAETFEAIIENTNESIWLLSPDLKVLQFNKTAKERILLNRGKEIYLGADLKEFLYAGSEKEFLSMFEEALTGKYTELEVPQTNQDGVVFWLRTRMFPV